MEIMEKNKIVQMMSRVQMMPGASTDIIYSSLIRHFVSGRVGNLFAKILYGNRSSCCQKDLSFHPHLKTLINFDNLN